MGKNLHNDDFEDCSVVSFCKVCISIVLEVGVTLIHVVVALVPSNFIVPLWIVPLAASIEGVFVFVIDGNNVNLPLANVQ